jgi:hypothetical protein
MMSVKDYLNKMPGTESFLALNDPEQEKWLFLATETLSEYIPARKITDKITAIQVLYMFKDDAEDFAVLKSQGVDTFSTEGLSVSFKDKGPSSISPVILDIISHGGRAGVGSII